MWSLLFKKKQGSAQENFLNDILETQFLEVLVIGLTFQII